MRALDLRALPWVGCCLLMVGVGHRGIGGVPGSLVLLVVMLTLAATALAVLASREGTHRLRTLLRMPAGLAFVAFLACYLISAVGGHQALTYAGVTLEMVVGALFAVAVAWWAHTPARVRSLLVVFMLGSFGAMVPSLFQAGELSVAYGGSVVSNRPSGSFVDPNELGVYSAISIVVATMLVGTAAHSWTRVIGVLAVAAAAGGLVLSFSRGSWLACLVGCAVLAMFAPLRKIVLGMVSAAILAVVGAWVGGFPLPVSTAAERLSTLFSGNTNPYDFRPYIWQEAWTLGWERPWLGWGPGSFRDLSAQPDSPIWRVPARHAHNGLLNSFAENGILTTSALVVLALTLVVPLWRLMRARDGGPLETRLAAGTFAVLCVIGAHLTIDYALRNFVVLLTVWFWVGLAWGQLLHSQTAAVPPTAAQPVRRLPTSSAPVPSRPRGRAPVSVAARHSALAGLGAIISAAAGLILLVVVARGLGAGATGIFSVTLAVAMVSLAISKWGYDTALVHVVPRLDDLGGRDQLPALLRASLVQVTMVSCLLALIIHLAAPWLAGWLLAGSDAEQVASALRAVAWSLPAAGPSLVLLSALRAHGEVRPLVMWDQIVKPLLRLVSVGGVVALGGDVVAAVLAWSITQWFVLLGSLWHSRRLWSGDAPRSPGLIDVVARYTRRRSASSVVEIVGMHVGILIVASIGSAEQAGLFGVASRAALAGGLALQAARLAMAPQISQALAAGDRGRAERLHVTSTSWVVLAAWPIYLTLIVASPQVMTIFGPEFRDGWPVLAILAGAGLVSVAVGNVQTVLLMSGYAGTYLAVSVASLLTNVAVGLGSVGAWGAAGVASAAAVATLAENAAIAVLVQRLTGVRSLGRPVVTAMLCGFAYVLVFTLVHAVVPPGVLGLLSAALGAGLVHLALVRLLRQVFRLEDVPAPTGSPDQLVPAPSTSPLVLPRATDHHRPLEGAPR